MCRIPAPRRFPSGCDFRYILAMTDSTKVPGDVWVFCQTTNDGKGYWYRAGPGRLDDEGRAIGKINLTPFRNFSGDLIVCPHDVEPPGAPPDPDFPLLRRADKINDKVEAPFGLLCGFTRVVRRSGKGYYQGIGVGWFEPDGRAHGKILLTDGQRIEHVAICPPGAKPPDATLPLDSAPHQPLRPGEDQLDDIEGDAEAL
jgi:hypothetical protein